jgi:hypothetical protein
MGVIIKKQYYWGYLVVGLSLVLTYAIYFGSMWFYDDWYEYRLKYLAKIGSMGTTMLMCWALVLAARLRIMERLFGGLDKVYKAHRRIGEAALYLIVLHPIFLALNPEFDFVRFFWIAQLPGEAGIHYVARMTGLIALAALVALIVVALDLDGLPPLETDAQFLRAGVGAGHLPRRRRPGRDHVVSGAWGLVRRVGRGRRCAAISISGCSTGGSDRSMTTWWIMSGLWATSPKCICARWIRSGRWSFTPASSCTSTSIRRICDPSRILSAFRRYHPSRDHPDIRQKAGRLDKRASCPEAGSAGLCLGALRQVRRPHEGTYGQGIRAGGRRDRDHALFEHGGG